VALAVPPIETKPFLAYLMLLVIVGGVGLACVKEGKVFASLTSLQPPHVMVKCGVTNVG
jgi:hypothetical protein